MRAARSGDSAPPSCAAYADPRRAGGCRGRLLLRVRGPSCRFHNGSNGRRGGKRVFPENFLMRNTGAPGRGSHGREIPHAQRAPAAVPDVRHGESGGSFLCACDAGGASMRLRVGFMMDPTAARGPDRVPPRSGCRICRGSPAAAPPDGKFPMRPKRVRRARRSMGSGAGEGRPADQMEGKGDRPDAIVRGSGRLCACGARVTHAICKRYRSHIPTQPI